MQQALGLSNPWLRSQNGGKTQRQNLFGSLEIENFIEKLAPKDIFKIFNEICDLWKSIQLRAKKIEANELQGNLLNCKLRFRMNLYLIDRSFYT